MDREFPQDQSVRMDKWLWAVRLFKTRSQASAACAHGLVSANGRPLKASTRLRVGQTIAIQAGGITRTVKVTGLLDKRVGASLVPNYLEDLTPSEEYAKRAEKREHGLVSWPKGLGRPTKRARRHLDRFIS